ncbi:hypothetical protein F4677DRAFT_460945 [Hypoxylon crocopeplum]|nr:hypothetical protein F4677DRAFT_460945 [Hypoxylon crocopeplum]
MSSQLTSSTTLNFGQRLLPTVIDDAAQNEPDRVLFCIPRNNNPCQGYDDVTAKIFGNSINRLCWWLESKLGSPTTPKTFGYVASNDLRYFLMMVAAAKLGHRFWITSSGIDNTDFIDELQIPRATAPELSNLLNHNMVPCYFYNKQFKEGRSDTLALLHTSGSTGFPKLVPLYLGTASAIDAIHLMEPIDGKLPTVIDWAGTKMLCAMPLFHTAGICFGLYGAIFFRWTVVLPSTGPVVQHVIEEALDNITLDSAFISPSVLQDISKSPRALEKISTLKFISSAGGPILQSVGETIHPRVPIYQAMGMTELQMIASVATHKDAWQYFHFHPRIGFEMQLASDNIYQLVFVRKESLHLTQSIFVTYPDLDRWESKDLYSRHTTIPNLWKYEMRADDLVVLSNGEKFNPLAAEGRLVSHPWIRSAYITGRHRFQAAGLLYVADDVDMRDYDIIKSVWPTIEEANRSLPSFAQIHRGFIKIVRNPFLLTPKGTLARKPTEDEFKADIEELYAQSGDDECSLSIDGTSQETLHAGIREAIRSVSDIRGIEESGNIFNAGFDSLHALRLVRVLKSSLSQPVEITASTIYKNPSTAQLSGYLWAQLHEEQRPTPDDKPLNAQMASQMLANYLPSFDRPRSKEYVVLTGSTGSIGPYLLDCLYKNDKVRRVWCLNRGENSYQRQVELAQSNGLPSNWNNKVQFLRYDLSSKSLGLRQAELQAITDQATIILHNTWEVNFNLHLQSFEPHIIGLRNLVNICRQTRAKIRFYFMSSISTALDWPCDRAGPVPEAEISDFEAPLNGYGASKLVAERLLASAARSGALSLSVFRVGQVGGPVQKFGDGSMWKRRDWVPALIDASAYLRMLPSNLGSFSELDWIPVDLLAEILGQLVLRTVEEGNDDEGYYNIVNPTRISWKYLLPIMKYRLEAAISAEIQIVTLKHWISTLQNAEASIVREISTPGDYKTASNAQTGLTLVPFFQMLDKTNTQDSSQAGDTYDDLRRCDWVVSKTTSHSSTLANLGPVCAMWMETWLDQWGYKMP